MNNRALFAMVLRIHVLLLLLYYHHYYDHRPKIVLSPAPHMYVLSQLI